MDVSENSNESSIEIEEQLDGANSTSSLSETKKNRKKKKKKKTFIWTLQIFVVTLILSFVFSFISEVIMSRAHIAVAVIVLLFIIVINIFFDIIGVAYASGDITPFLSMSSRKVRGAKTCVNLLKNADRVSNICSDVVGDICGIISGSAGAVIAIMIAQNIEFWQQLLIAIITSSVIAALTVCGKSIFKSLAIKNSHKIIYLTGKLLSIFGKNK